MKYKPVHEDIYLLPVYSSLVLFFSLFFFFNEEGTRSMKNERINIFSYYPSYVKAMI